jgi:hypothetical protein
MGYGFYDWVCSHFFTITVDYISSHIELLPNDVSMKNLSLLSESRTGLCYSRIHESTAFYNFHAARIEQLSSVILVVTGMPLLTFVTAGTSVYLAVA